MSCYRQAGSPADNHNRSPPAYQHTIGSIRRCSADTRHVHICRPARLPSRGSPESYHTPSTAECTSHRRNRIPFCGHMFASEQLKIEFCETAIERRIFRCLRQFSSSLPSLHSALPEQWKWPAMHDLSAHWNWSARHVMFWQLGIISSSPLGQSCSPSHIQLRWMHVMPSLHKYSACTHEIGVLRWLLSIVVQFWVRENYEFLIRSEFRSALRQVVAILMNIIANSIPNENPSGIHLLIFKVRSASRPEW